MSAYLTATDRADDPVPRLIATDVDGTLLDAAGHVSAYTAEVVARAENAGTRVVLVSGRPPRWMHEIADELGHRGIAICSNGAVRYDLATEQIVHADPITPELLTDVVDVLRTAIPNLGFAVEYGLDRAYEVGYHPNWPAPHDGPQPLSAVLARPAVKLLVRHPSMTPDIFSQRARELVGDRATVTHSSVDGLLEISAAGVTKATGLAAYLAELGIEPSDVVAFGDMPNDLPMLTFVGRGFAVANAHPDVRAAADEVVGAHHADGVAATLARWFPG